MSTYIASHLKDMNRLAVYHLISSQEEMSRAEIARRTGISVPTVLKIMDFLMETGLVLEGGAAKTPFGRRPQMFIHNKNRHYAIGAVHEGDYLKVGIVNLNDETLAFQRVDARKSLETVLGPLFFQVIDELIGQSGVDPGDILGIGLGLPGIYNPVDMSIMTAPLIGISEKTSIQAYTRAISRRYGLDVIVENDLNMEVQGEFQSLGLGPADDLVYVSLGTGLGSGVMLQGNLRRGVNNMCGEIGYMSFLENYVADTHVVGWLENRINLNGLRQQFGITADNADKLPEEVLAVCTEYVANAMALCVNNIVLCYDCGHISLGGEVFDLLGPRLFQAVQQKVARLCVADVLLHPKKGREPGVVGAAAMVNNKHIERILCEA